jgi:hypothetical protein
MPTVTRCFKRAWSLRARSAKRRSAHHMKANAHRAQRRASRVAVRRDWWEGRDDRKRPLTSWEVC